MNASIVFALALVATLASATMPVLQAPMSKPSDKAPLSTDDSELWLHPIYRPIYRPVVVVPPPIVPVYRPVRRPVVVVGRPILRRWEGSPTTDEGASKEHA
ncbi:hypothetical protein H310_12995 [Aphanomyces invadans]|uniref:RxLR effector protein n=1 Tax=Aphanomyces invadans TaxID=157072 RepID=A0A024TGQ6_9STRA|nr:hypothetical protein H310_12995 [Aphanomyces invadans]ETV92766.1 hypothetical protein H310_12995 [Aphanomyces invadans]|eukprot:XP_008878536.1 hypothetical protein H310_12995 [Aphanomyces invadans]